MLIRIIFLSLFSLVLSAQAAAASRVVRVGIYDNAPKLYVDPNEGPEGILVDLLKEVAKAEDWELRFVRCATCGCVLCWQRVRPNPERKMGVNIRNFGLDVLGSVRVQPLDGAAWDGRTH